MQPDLLVFISNVTPRWEMEAGTAGRLPETRQGMSFRRKNKKKRLDLRYCGRKAAKFV